MDIVFNEPYHDKEAENSDDGSQEVFSANRTYSVKESFGKKMIQVKKATAVSDRVKKTFKHNKED